MEQSRNAEAYVSVDIEAAGPIPGEYSMLSLGACLVEDPRISFYAELRPINEKYIPDALKVGGLSLERLRQEGQDPGVVMPALKAWLEQVVGERRAVFVGFNASFDWAFVNWYFHVYIGTNPFGIGALDIKAYYMGLSGVSWAETSASRLPQEFRGIQAQTHNALDDAIAQGQIFQNMLIANG